MQKYLSEFDGLDKLRYSRHVRLHVLCCVCITIIITTPSFPTPSLSYTHKQQSPQMRRLNIVDIDEPLAKAAPMVKAAHDLNEDFLFSMFQFKASYIHT